MDECKHNHHCSKPQFMAAHERRIRGHIARIKKEKRFLRDNNISPLEDYSAGMFDLLVDK